MVNIFSCYNATASFLKIYITFSLSMMLPSSPFYVSLEINVLELPLVINLNEHEAHDLHFSLSIVKSCHFPTLPQ
jgi:hypothetical protein